MYPGCPGAQYVDQAGLASRECWDQRCASSMPDLACHFFLGNIGQEVRTLSGWEYSLVLEHLPSVREVLNSIPSKAKE